MISKYINRKPGASEPIFNREIAMQLSNKAIYTYHRAVKGKVYGGEAYVGQIEDALIVLAVLEYQDRNKNYNVFNNLIVEIEQYCVQNGINGMVVIVKGANLDVSLKKMGYTKLDIDSKYYAIKVINKSSCYIDTLRDLHDKSKVHNEQLKIESEEYKNKMHNAYCRRLAGYNIYMNKKYIDIELRKQEEQREKIAKEKEYLERINRNMVQCPEIVDRYYYVDGEKYIMPIWESHIASLAIVNMFDDEVLKYIWNNLTSMQLEQLIYQDFYKNTEIAEIFDVGRVALENKFKKLGMQSRKKYDRYVATRKLSKAKNIEIELDEQSFNNIINGEVNGYFTLKDFAIRKIGKNTKVYLLNKNGDRKEIQILKKVYEKCFKAFYLQYKNNHIINCKRFCEADLVTRFEEDIQTLASERQEEYYHVVAIYFKVI